MIKDMEDKDQFILDELIEQRSWWEKQIKDCENKKKCYEIELAKANRLIEVFESKINKQ
jgi:hypothetical protein